MIVGSDAAGGAVWRRSSWAAKGAFALIGSPDAGTGLAAECVFALALVVRCDGGSQHIKLMVTMRSEGGHLSIGDNTGRLRAQSRGRTHSVELLHPSPHAS